MVKVQPGIQNSPLFGIDSYAKMVPKMHRNTCSDYKHKFKINKSQLQMQPSNC